MTKKEKDEAITVLTSDDPNENALLQAAGGRGEGFLPTEMNPVDELGEMIGVIKAHQFYAQEAQYLQAVQLKALKDNKRKWNTITDENGQKKYPNWDALCESRFGFSGKTGSEKIKNLEAYGKDTYLALTSISLRDKDFKLLRSGNGPKALSAPDGTPVLELDGGEQIAITADNAEEIKETLDLQHEKLKKEKELAQARSEHEKEKRQKAEQETRDLKDEINFIKNPLRDFWKFKEALKENEVALIDFFTELTKMSEKVTNSKDQPFIEAFAEHFENVEELYNDKMSDLR